MDNPSKRKHSVAAGPSPQAPTASPDPDKRRKVIGPSLPPPTEPSKSGDYSDSDYSDDDDFGPNLPPPAGSVPLPQPTQQASISTSTDKQAAEKSAPQRDAWMLAPPTGDTRSSRVDPTKLRNRKFQSGPRVGGGASSGGGGGVDSSWTETPEEKIRRLQNEAMGIVSSGSSGSAGGGGAGAGTEAEERKAQAMREQVQKYNERVRKEDAAAFEERKKKGKEEEDDPSKRAFDKEKDMGLGGRISHAQRREMMNKAADFGSRFSKGKFL
ncbi:hypothetical protein ASPCAL07299 [Aspergillus calidoustus]|uniref:DUF3752 domain-containing protein n=1 Tax=Aspergillus calidoustus TaxID=454130 RepID=A0A0U5G3A1_ASPCI|nr:hypothetical protein ASPCAL07299 [Aspergillus calidoustus]